MVYMVNAMISLRYNTNELLVFVCGVNYVHTLTPFAPDFTTQHVPQLHVVPAAL